MRESLYNWVRCLAVFYILLNMLLHLVPTEKYQRYVRFFMGLVLIVMLLTPVLSILRKTRELPGSFQMFYEQEEKDRLQKEMENLQKTWLEKGCEQQIAKNIQENLQKDGIETQACEVHIEGELLKVSVWTKEAPDEELEGRIKDELGKEWGVQNENCEIFSWKDGSQTVGDPPSSGNAADGDRASGVKEKENQ